MDWAKLIGSLAWPLTVLFLVWFFRRSVERLITSLAKRRVVFGKEGLVLEEMERRMKLLGGEVKTLALQSPEIATPYATHDEVDEDLWNSDPRKGQWGGKSEDQEHHVRVRAGRIEPLVGDPDSFWVPLIVKSTDPAQPLPEGMEVKFHLHPTFDPDVMTVPVKHGAAKTTLVANAGFTVGVELPDTKLELDLCSDEVKAPKEFKEG
jgi:hypothetical protein